MMRVPSTVLLLRVLVQLVVVLAQTAGLGGGPLRHTRAWSGLEAMEMDELCWRTFGCVCLALVVGSIGRCLEGTAQIVRL